MDKMKGENGLQTVAKFEKVSFEVFKEACMKQGVADTDAVVTAYENIRLPRRATKGSAGYDFFSPFDYSIDKNTAVVIPTGIRCKMDEGWVLTLCPRSGMGFKTGMRLANTVGIIDQDYYFSDNEGHIMVKFVNESAIGRLVDIHQGDAVCQGIFLPFGIAQGDDTEDVRNGGFGSSGR